MVSKKTTAMICIQEVGNETAFRSNEEYEKNFPLPNLDFRANYTFTCRTDSLWNDLNRVK